MSAGQLLLFPNPRPLVERLGREFFLRLPNEPGVYLMRDAAEAVLYVGKALNLRRRLHGYRVANPDRLPRRHLRLLRAVTSIDWEICADERAALAREAELLRVLRPPFNRAGTWPAPPRFLVWRAVGGCLELAVVETPGEGWRAWGPLGGGAHALRSVLLRLLWTGLNPGKGMADLPLGWFRGAADAVAGLPGGAGLEQANCRLEALPRGDRGAFADWVRAALPAEASSFDLLAVEEDLGFLNQFRLPHCH